MKAYKFRNTTKRHLQSLRDKELYAANYKELNDPFETITTLSPINNSSYDIKTAIRDYFIFGSNPTSLPEGIRIAIDERINNLSPYDKRQRKKYPERFGRNFFQKTGIVKLEKIEQYTRSYIEASKNRGIYSLSRSIYNELMWAHYSDSHRGFAIEFDLSKFEVMQISMQYSNQPQDISIFDFNGSDACLNVFFQKNFGQKSKAWKYEEEVRMLFSRGGIQKYSCDAVTGIYFGLRMEDQYKQYIHRLFQDTHVKIYQIRHKSDSYELEAEELMKK